MVAERQLNMKKSNEKVLKLCELAMLVALELLMAFTPLGFLNLGVISASLLSIPVAVGAIMLGTMESTFLGLVFGLISFYKGFTSAAAMTIAMYAASVPASFVVAVGGRVLMGLFTGLAVAAVRKVSKKKGSTLDCIVGSLAAPLLNTTFYMGLLMVFFYHLEFIQDLIHKLGVSNPILLIFAMVGVQALIEAGTCGVIGTAVTKVLKVALKK